MGNAVSILILAHNKAAYTRRCLDSLFHSTCRPFQVLLVNNGSTDETGAVFEEFRKRSLAASITTEILAWPENVGAIEGRNRGMERLTGDFWVFLDNDVVVRTRTWLERLREVLRADERLGVVGPKLVYPLPPHAIQCAGCAVTQGGQVIFSGRGEPRTAPAWNAPRDCQTLISACWMLRGAAAKAIGPLDARFAPVQFEDIDYCYRLREAGWRCRFEPAAEMYHFENVTTGRSGALNYPYLTVKHGLKFKEKWRHCFSREDGPADEAWTWAPIPTVQLEEVPSELELLP